MPFVIVVEEPEIAEDRLEERVWRPESGRSASDITRHKEGGWGERGTVGGHERSEC